MNHALGTPRVQALWAKLESFQLDNNNAVFDFSARLASENGWTRAFTARAIQEYKRFLLLALHAGHPVTPSEVVDQVWHLHLVYTRSYWQDLCQHVLGRPLHHEPTAGGLDESAKFHLEYERTLSSYRRLFDTDPPADIWPSAEDCFKPKLNRWVDVSRHWTLPNPPWLKRLLQPRYVLPAAAALVIACALPACSQLNVLDYRGEAFLKFYILGFLVALFLSLLLVRIASDQRHPRLGDPPLTDPYEIAFLGGGGRRMIDAALASLFTRGLLALDTPKNGRATLGALRGANATQPMHPIEAQVLRALPTGSRTEVRHLRKALIPVTQSMQESLADRGLLFRAAALTHLRWLAALPLLLLLILGIMKFVVGISRDKPVIFLLFGLILTFITLCLRLSLLKKRTLAGEALWKQLSSRLNLKLQHIRPLLNPANRQPQHPDLAAMAVALTGTSVLNTPSYQPLHHAIHRQNLGSTTGCGSGGCGTSGGGGCGGSCGGGGGGCGGCGGGGD